MASYFIDYERAYAERDFWYNHSHTDFGDYLGAIDPVHGDDEGAPTGYTEFYDPLVGIMDALSRSPQAGVWVFTSGQTEDVTIEGEPVAVDTYLKYLIMDRRWPVRGGEESYAAISAALTPYDGGPVESAAVAADTVNILTAFEEELLARTEDKNPIAEIGHLVLDIFGMIPVLGEPADGLNAVWYFAEGDVVNGALSAGALLPIGGWIATGGKWIRRGDAAADIAQAGLRLSDLPDLARIADGPGNFRRARPGRHSASSGAYQQQVSGFPSEFGYWVDDVEFDGYLDGTLLDAKGPNYAWMVREGEFRQGFNVRTEAVRQAQRQLDAADGVPVQWHVAEPEAAQAFRNLFADGGLDIEVIHVPFDG